MKGNTMAKKRKAVRRKKPAKRATKKRVVKRKAKKTAKRRSGLKQSSYNVSSALEAVVGGGKKTRPEIVKKLWAYIKAHKCKDTKNRRLIVPDAKLSAVFGGRPVDMFKIMGMLNKHIRA